MRVPNICVLTTDGTNCAHETAHAFALAGGRPSLVHVNELRNGTVHLRDYQILALPGGFSYGDDTGSGRVLANELITFFRDQISEFIGDPTKLVIGICNGFQVLVRTGLLPGRTLGTMGATLATNHSGRFECRWVTTKVEKGTQCVFFRKATPDIVIPLPVAHGEGRFWAPPQTLDQMEKDGRVVLRYIDDIGHVTQRHPFNPNQSERAIAGVCDSTGRIFGLMPHPERFTERTQHPNWRRYPSMVPLGRLVFESAVEYVAEHSRIS